MAKKTLDPTLPDWWQREKQRRQLMFLIFLLLLLTLIAYYYWVARHGIIGQVRDIDFDSSNYVAFTHQEKDGNVSLYAVRADGGDARRLTAADDTSNKQDPAWTLDGKNLLYSTNKTDKQVMQIWKIGNGDAKQATYGPGNKFAPVASPDGKSFAFVTQGAIKTELLIGGPVDQALPPPRAGNSTEGEGTAPGETELHGPFQTPVFSTDGLGLASVQSLSAEDNPEDITRYGEQVARAVFPPGGDYAEILSPGREVGVTWEPGSDRLACAFAEFQPPRPAPAAPLPPLVSGITLWKSNPAAKKNEPKASATPLFVASGFLIEPRNPVWSPDGKTIAFECWRLKSENEREPLGIVLWPADKTNVKVTAADIANLPFLIKASPGGRPQLPRWSSNSSRLLFETVKSDGLRDLWIINTDGSNPTNLTGSLGGDNSQGAWGPNRK